MIFERFILLLFTPALLISLIVSEFRRVLKGTIIIKLFKRDFYYYWNNPNKVFH